MYVLYMGKISIDDLIKIIKILKTIKDKKKRRTKRKQLQKMLNENTYKSSSNHMMGSVNTHQTNLQTEALDIANKTNAQQFKQLSNVDNNFADIHKKLSDLNDDQNDFKQNANKFVFNVNNKLTDIENKLNRPTNQPKKINRMSFSPQKIDLNDSYDVPNTDVVLHAQTKMPTEQTFDDAKTPQKVDYTISPSEVPQYNEKTNQYNYNTPSKTYSEHNEDLLQYVPITNEGYKRYKIEIDKLYEQYIEICNKNNLTPNHDYDYFAITEHDNYQSSQYKIKALKDNIVYAKKGLNTSVSIQTPQKKQLTKDEHKEYSEIMKNKYQDYLKLCTEYNVKPLHDYNYYSVKKHDTLEIYNEKFSKLTYDMNSVQTTVESNEGQAREEESLLQVLSEKINETDYKKYTKNMKQLYDTYINECDNNVDVEPMSYKHFSINKNSTYQDYNDKIDELQELIDNSDVDVIQRYYYNKYLPLCKKKKIEPLSYENFSLKKVAGRYMQMDIYAKKKKLLDEIKKLSS